MYAFCYNQCLLENYPRDIVTSWNLYVFCHRLVYFNTLSFWLLVIFDWFAESILCWPNFVTPQYLLGMFVDIWCKVTLNNYCNIDLDCWTQKWWSEGNKLTVQVSRWTGNRSTCLCAQTTRHLTVWSSQGVTVMVCHHLH